tara:strand:+ start:12112 stop:12303 length:192 start_codon:yes stop_codon:yes gene_type:complete
MLENIKKYFKNKKKLSEKNEQLMHQIVLMQTHIQVQTDELIKLRRELDISKQMLDLANLTKRY